MIDSTLCFPIKDNPPAQVMLGFKKRGFGEGKYTGIGGKIEAGETAIEAARRELLEETGLAAGVTGLRPAGRVTFRFPARPAWNMAVHLFLVMDWVGPPVESDEIKPVWYNINELPFDQMWQDSRHWLPDILTGQIIEADFIFQDDNESVAQFTIAYLMEDV